MKCVLLSGGKGKRLWPISTDDAPKQFVHLFNDNESMLKRTYDAISNIIDSRDIFIATGEEYRNDVLSEINDFSNFIFEPSYIGTFGAILNIAVYFREKLAIPLDEVISIIPIDHDVSIDFYKDVFKAEDVLKNINSDICLVGVKPTFPSTQYGYISHDSGYVTSFFEKPDFDKALLLMNNGALWNSGVVNFRLKRIIDLSKKYLSFKNYDDFYKQYDSLAHTSFDYEVLEKEESISLIATDYTWNDIGTWDILASKLSVSDKYNTNIINFDKKKIVNDGVCDSIIINSKEGIRLIKKDIDDMVFRQWGYYKVLNVFNSPFLHIKVKELTLLPNKNISYQYHKYRNEEWFVLSGNGEIVINGKHLNITAGDVVTVDKMKNHSIRAIDTLKIIEVQYSDVMVEEDDIVRLEYDWDKIIG